LILQAFLVDQAFLVIGNVELFVILRFTSDPGHLIVEKLLVLLLYQFMLLLVDS